MNEKEYNKLSEEEKAMQKNKGRFAKIEEELQFIDGLIEDNNEDIEQNSNTIESEISKNPNMVIFIDRETPEENSPKKKIKASKEYFYAFEILSNSGYSKGNSTTSKPQARE